MLELAPTTDPTAGASAMHDVCGHALLVSSPGFTNEYRLGLELDTEGRARAADALRT